MPKLSPDALAEVRRQLAGYIAEVERSGLAEKSKWTYTHHAETFVRWLADDFQPGVRTSGEGIAQETSKPNQDLSFDAIWEKIRLHAGETFRQVRGGEFTYTVHGKTLLPNRTDWQLSYEQFRKAFERMPVSGPGELGDLQGPSYLYAILADARVMDRRKC